MIIYGLVTVILGSCVYLLSNMFITTLKEVVDEDGETDFEISWMRFFVLVKDENRNCMHYFSNKLIYLLTMTVISFFTVTGYLSNQSVWYLTIFLLLILAMEAISIIDYHTQIIPDALNVVVGVLAVLNYIISKPFTIKQLLLGVLIGGGFYLLLAFLGGMGGGDVKLMAAGGILLGYPKVLVGIMSGLVLGAVISIILMILGLKTRKDRIPFGPFIAMGIVIAELFFREIIFLLYGI